MALSNDLEILQSMGRRIKEVRRERNIKQVELARLISVHKSGMSSIEVGRRNITVATLQKIADALGVPVHTLLEPMEGKHEI